MDRIDYWTAYTRKPTTFPPTHIAVLDTWDGAFSESKSSPFQEFFFLLEAALWPAEVKIKILRISNAEFFETKKPRLVCEPAHDEGCEKRRGEQDTVPLGSWLMNG